MIILGDKEEKENKVAIRKRNGEDLGQMDLSKFIEKIKVEIESKSLA